MGSATSTPSQPATRPVAGAQPRVAPGTRAQLGRFNALIADALGAAVGSGPLNLFTTLGRQRPLFRRWLRFAEALMPGGTLPRADTELVILRVAHLCECEYERIPHERIAAQAGLSPEQIAAAGAGPGAGVWGPGERALLRAVDELFERRRVSDDTWEALRGRYSEEQLIELLMLIGHYEMLAGVINSLGIQPDTHTPPAGGIAGLLGRRIARRAS